MFRLSILVVALASLAFGADSWDALRRIPADQTIRVIDNRMHSQTGALLRVEPETLFLRVSGQEVAVP